MCPFVDGKGATEASFPGSEADDSASAIVIPSSEEGMDRH